MPEDITPDAAVKAQEPEEGQKVEKEERTFPESYLPEELRGMDPAQVQLVLQQMPRVIRNQRDELERLGNLGMEATPSTAATEAEEPIDLREMLEEDPEAALSYWVEKKYGPSLQDLTSRVGESEIDRFRSQVDEFADYEDDVRTILRESGQPATRVNIHGALAMAVGNRQLEANAQKRRAEAESVSVGRTAEPEQETRELSSLEEEVRGRLKLSKEDYIKYAGEDVDIGNLLEI